MPVFSSFGGFLPLFPAVLFKVCFCVGDLARRECLEATCDADGMFKVSQVKTDLEQNRLWVQKNNAIFVVSL